MMRRGVWCPEGAEINHEAALEVAGQSLEKPGCHDWKGWGEASWITGTPARDGADASYHLSSLYALSLGWGDIAKEFVASKDVPQSLRNFVNQWLGETWEIVERKQTWEELGNRLIISVPCGIVPAGYSLVTMGVDKQIDHYVYTVDAWKEGRTSHTLAYGTADTLDEIRENLLDKTFPRESGMPLKIQCTLVDGRFRPNDVYKFCAEMLGQQRAVYPAFGSPNALGAECRMVKLGKNTPMPNFPAVHVDTISTQDFLEQQLHTLKPGDRGATSLFNESLAYHQHFLEQLLNDAIVPTIDSNNYIKEIWQRINETLPNDFRDCKRLAYVAYLVATKGADLRPQKPESVTERKKPNRKFKFRRLNLRKRND